MSKLAYKGIDIMGWTKDTLRNPVTQEAINAQVEGLARDFDITHIAISVPINTQAETIAEDVAPFSLEPAVYAKMFADAIHGQGLGVLWRQTDCYFEGIYDFPKWVGTSRYPAGDPEDVISGADRANWLGRIYNYIINNPTMFEHGDLWGVLPEATGHGIFNDATSFLPHDGDGIQANFANFFINVGIVSKEAFKIIGKNVRTGFSAQNASEIFNGWVPSSLHNSQGLGRVNIDHYGTGGADYSPTEMSDDLDEIFSENGGKPIFHQEWGDYWSTDPAYGYNRNQAAHEAYLESMYAVWQDKIDNDKLLGFNYWRSVGGAEAVYTNDGNEEDPLDWHPTYEGDVLAAFFAANEVVEDPTYEGDFPIFAMTPSTNITDGEATTARLTAPAGKTTGDFDAGKIHDTSNPAGSVDIGEDGYTEMEYCIRPKIGAVVDATYEFRLVNTDLDTYTEYPEMTIEGEPEPELEQHSYRFRNDDGAENNASWLSALNTAITRVANLPARLRVLINATNNPDPSQFQLEYKKQGDADWLAVEPEAGSGVLYSDDFNLEGLRPFWQLTTSPGSEIDLVDNKVRFLGWGGYASTMWVSTALSMGNKYAQVKVVDPSDDCAMFLSPTIDADTQFDIYNKSNWYRLLMADGDFVVQRRKNGALSSLSSVAQPTEPFWIRIRLSQTHIFFEYATSEPTGDGDWTLIFSEFWNIGVPLSTPVYVGLNSWDEDTNGAFWIDDFKLVDNVSNRAFVLSNSVNITNGGATTNQLPAPSGKTSGDFLAGAIQDTTNPTSSINLGLDQFTELEFSIMGTDEAQEDVYQFRITVAGTPLTTYTEYPEWDFTVSEVQMLPKRKAKLSVGFVDEYINLFTGYSTMPTVDRKKREAKIHFEDELGFLSDVNLTGGQLLLNIRTDRYIWGILDYVYGEHFTEIAGCNTDETWTGAIDDEINYRYGDACKKLEAEAEASEEMSLAISSLDLSSYTSEDKFFMFLFIDDPDAVENLEIRLGDSSLTNYYSINGLTLRSGWNHVLVDKGDFVATGSPTWADIDKIAILLEANDTGSVYILVDQIRMYDYVNYPPRFIDVGLQFIPVAWWAGNKSLFEIQVASEAEGARFYADEEGILRFENRQYYNLDSRYKTTQWLFEFNRLSEFEYPGKETDIINNVVVKLKPRIIASEQDIWQYGFTSPIGASETKQIWASLLDPAPADETGILNPVANTDYTANSQADGLGDDLTADISIVITRFANAVILDVTNNGTGTAYITLLKLRGTPAIQSDEVLIRSEDADSIETFGRRPRGGYEIDNKYLADESFAQSLADSIVEKYKQPLSRIRITGRAVPQLQLGDMITVRDLTNNQSFLMRVTWLKIRLATNVGMFQEIHCREVVTQETFSYFTIGTSAIAGEDVISP